MTQGSMDGGYPLNKAVHSVWSRASRSVHPHCGASSGGGPAEPPLFSFLAPLLAWLSLCFSWHPALTPETQHRDQTTDKRPHHQLPSTPCCLPASARSGLTHGNVLLLLINLGEKTTRFLEGLAGGGGKKGYPFSSGQRG